MDMQKVSFLMHRSRQLYRIEGPHQPPHILCDALLKTAIKQKQSTSFSLHALLDQTKLKELLRNSLYFGLKYAFTLFLFLLQYEIVSKLQVSHQNAFTLWLQRHCFNLNELVDRAS
jgi:hypothetical protein